MIVFENLPLPPSDNHAYRSMMVRGKIIRSKSAEYRAFCAAMTRWHWQNKTAVSQALREIRSATGRFWDIETIFCFHRKRLFCQDGSVRKLDASNRVPLLHDALTHILELDDRFFFSGRFAKVQIPETGQERAIVRLSVCSLVELPA